MADSNVMADEPSLPRLPAVSWSEETQSFSNNPKKRVRARRSSSASALNSSDPAVFSSDDDPALDNYIEGRKKRKYVGTWFHQQPVASSDSAFEDIHSRPLPKTRRTFKRQLDSGVWMGSDGTDEGFDDVQLPMQSKLPELAVRPAVAPKPAISVAERHAREAIQECLDDGKETVDLSGFKLESLSDSTIEPLANLSCIPLVAKDVPFEQEPPSIKLILATNLLNRVPGAIFSLENLTLLSLRSCGLTELPPAIGRLTRLQTLNIAQNRLRYLPGELLDLIAAPGQLTSLLMQGNCFWQASQLPTERPIDRALSDQFRGQAQGLRASGAGTTGGIAQLPEDGLLKLNSCSEMTELEAPLARRLPLGPLEGVAARYFARSPVQYRDSTGHICSTFTLEDSYDDKKVPIETREPVLVYATPPSSAVQSSRSEKVSSSRGAFVPSLLELAARSCYTSAELEDLPDYIPESLSSLRAVLDRAAAQRAVGGYTCWRCKKTMVTPATEWLEWWQVARVKRSDNSVSTDFLPWSETAEEQAVPFLKKGCSWGCVPEERTIGAWAVGDTL